MTRRPRYHLTARSGWVNDPIGMTFRDAVVHLFFQYVPDSTTWAPACHWGHATSTDLVSWTEHEPALVPGDGDDGCWTGCVVVDGQRVQALYTSVREPDLAMGVVRAAVPPDPSWLGPWQKQAVVVSAPATPAVTAFRDPFVWREAQTWRMLVGAATSEGAAALGFSSRDLAQWDYDGVVASRRPDAPGEPTGTMWECPQLVRIGDRTALLVSVWEDDELRQVVVGHPGGEGTGTDASTLEVRRWQRLSHGPGHYATTVFADDTGAPGVLHWIRGVGDEATGWTGALSVPQTVRLDGAELIAEPHPRVVAAGRAVDLPSTGELPSPYCSISARTSALQVTGPTGVVLDVHRTEGHWVVTGAGDPVEVPERGGGHLVVLLDGCLAEVFLGRSGIVAVPVADPGERPGLVLAEGVSGARVLDFG